VPHFLQKSATAYQDFRCQRDPAFSTIVSREPSQVQLEPEIQGKQAANLLHLFTVMYNLRIISCELIFDMVRELLEAKKVEGESPEDELVHESAVELVLIVVRSEFHSRNIAIIPHRTNVLYQIRVLNLDQTIQTH
jgi:hypothetical protein